MMHIKKYKELKEREHKLLQEMRDFIIDAIKAKNGRISYVSPDKDDEDMLLEDKYPIISTLWGIHGTYDIAITDVYVKENPIGQVEIYANGIDQNMKTEQKGFLIYPEQFSDIAYFITAPFLYYIDNYADRLALKDLIDKYGKLPSEFREKNGQIKNVFSEEYHNCLDNYRCEIEQMMIKCSESEHSKHDINSELMGIISELAELALIERNQLLMNAMTEDCNGEIRFTEEKQDEFNNLYNEIEGQIWEFMGFNGVN